MSIDLLFEMGQQAVLSSVDILAISAQLGFYSPAERFSAVPVVSERIGNPASPRRGSSIFR